MYISSGCNALYVHLKLFFRFSKYHFTKSIRLPTSFYKDYFIRNDIALAALFWFIPAMDVENYLKTAI